MPGIVYGRDVWLMFAVKRYGGEAEWIDGDGRYAVFAPCNVLTITLYPDPQKALHAKAELDYMGCGSMCDEWLHHAVDLASPSLVTYSGSP